MLEEPKPSQHHMASHLDQHLGVSCKKEAKKRPEVVASLGSGLLRRDESESFVQKFTERREQHRCSLVPLSSLPVSLMGSLTTGAVQRRKPRKRHTMGEKSDIRK